mgnify:CR=1 FL=1
MDKVVALLWWVVTLPAFIAFVAKWLVGILKKNKEKKWLVTLTRLVVEAYKFANEQGVIDNLKGHEKLVPFFDKFIADFEMEFGEAPTPEIRGKAVSIMEEQVKKEHL